MVRTPRVHRCPLWGAPTTSLPLTEVWFQTGLRHARLPPTAGRIVSAPVRVVPRTTHTTARPNVPGALGRGEWQGVWGSVLRNLPASDVLITALLTMATGQACVRWPPCPHPPGGLGHLRACPHVHCLRSLGPPEQSAAERGP